MLFLDRLSSFETIFVRHSTEEITVTSILPEFDLQPQTQLYFPHTTSWGFGFCFLEAVQNFFPHVLGSILLLEEAYCCGPDHQLRVY